jgi:hypothetical protein
MEWYDFSDWIEWPEAQIREYAREIADDAQLTKQQADFLARYMAQQAGFWPGSQREKFYHYPQKLSDATEVMLREPITYGWDHSEAVGPDIWGPTLMHDADARVFAENVRLNRPGKPPPTLDQWKLATKSVGSGLTKKFVVERLREPDTLRRERRHARRRESRRPFSAMNMGIKIRSTDALWASNCLRIDHEEWLIPHGQDKPFEGLVWYSEQLMRAYWNARIQADLGNLEGAMWHAFRAGAFHAETEMRMLHGSKFDKYDAVNLAQKDAARARKTVSDELRRATYQRYRADGNKRIEAGRMAALELGLSESSIRNAFPDGKYPRD